MRLVVDIGCPNDVVPVYCMDQGPVQYYNITVVQISGNLEAEYTPTEIPSRLYKQAFCPEPVR